MKPLLTKDHVKIFKGKYYLPWFKKQEVVHFKIPIKVVVLDLDETLGSFADLHILWSGIKLMWPSCTSFYDLCELFPEFLRYGILTILEYLYDKKYKKECSKIIIYTNNQCSPEWVSLISDYLEMKVKSTRRKNIQLQLFDKPICAFKIKKKQVETSRTGHRKTLDDFFSCSLVTKDVDICFVDDVEYPAMKSTKVYYICPKPYLHSLPKNEIIKRIVNAPWILQNKILSNESFWRHWFKNHRQKQTTISKNIDVDIDLQVTEKIINHLREFIKFGTIPPFKMKKTTRTKKIKRERQTKKSRMEIMSQKIEFIHLLQSHHTKS